MHNPQTDPPDAHTPDGTSRQTRLREITEDIIGCACLFVTLWGALWIAAALGAA